jgi:predicted alpha/beta superfamily hydrolase
MSSFFRMATLCLSLLSPLSGGWAQETADTLTINSTILGQSRRVFVSVPPSHSQTARTYPVLLVLDGEYNFVSANTITKQLVALGHIPEAIVVAIPNAGNHPRDRVYDMTPPGMSVSGSDRQQGGDKFLDFIEKELLPEIRTRYRGGAPNLLVGHSSGGVIVTYAAATRPATFPVVVSIDAPMHLDGSWLVQQMLKRTQQPEPLRYVSLETRFGWSDDSWQKLIDAAPKSWLLKRARLDGESHESMGFLAMYQGLKFAFSDYSVVGAPLIPRGSALAAFDHYARIEQAFKTELPPPQRALQRMVEDLLTEARVEPARRALAWLTRGYGASEKKAELERMIAHAATLPPLEETVDSLKAAPWPTPQQIAPYIGEWKGEHWMNPEARTPELLRIAVVDGKVVAENAFWPEPGVEIKRNVEYLKVTAHGLEFGNMNGMRPMGMIVNEGKRNGNVLEGTSGFRGIRLPLPDGFMPPPIYFRLVKQ